jgi:hypothetical protein
VADEQRATIGVEVGLGERERLTDPQPGAPQHDDHPAQPGTVRTITGRAHHGDDLLHAWRIWWIPNPFVARRPAAVKGGRGRWGPEPPGTVRQQDGLHDVLLRMVVDTTILDGRADPAAARNGSRAVTPG